MTGFTSLQYGNIHDAPVPTNVFNLPMGLLNVWLQPSVFQAILVLAVGALLVYVLFIWLTHR